MEFAKSRAHANRFTEEVQLAFTKMNRILKFYAHKSEEWLTHAETAADEGYRAYAHRQAAMYLSLWTRCIALWQGVPEYVGRMQNIIQNPHLAAPGEFDPSTLLKGYRG